MKIKYIDNDPIKGIDYDWNLIMKEYKKLRVPPEYDYSDILPLNTPIKWYLLISERSVGKTTTLLLLGLIMNKLYGTTIQIIRHHICNASYYGKLFETINGYNQGEYIHKIYGSEYDCISYYQRSFYLSKSKNGKRERVSDEPVAVALSADDCYELCSKYEAPKGDLIILDECFNDKNVPEEFNRFLHLHKTIVRERMSDKIFILGNNIDYNKIWFRQMTIANNIRQLKKGESRILYTCEDMPIYCHFLQNRAPESRKLFNRLHYGFNRSELNSITGLGDWNFKEYPLIRSVKNRNIIVRGIYFSYHDDLFLEGGFMKSDSGYYFIIHPCRMESAKKSSLCYVMETPTEANQIYFGNDRICEKIKKCILQKRILFSDNQSGDLFYKFLQELSG